ncbi:tripartite tricarboxylate transporter substrate-binding protein [Bordetella pertussis]
MSAMAGEFPQKPIRFISPSPPGGVTDFLPRLLGQEMSKILGQPVVIENRTGGNQTIATNYVAKAARTDTPSCSPRRARWRSTRI